MRNKKARKTAVAAVLTAFSTVFMLLGSVLPTGQLGFLGIASLFGVAAVVELGVVGGALVAAATAILGLLLVPSETLKILYVVFFGPYPVVKALSEKLKWPLNLIPKIVFFNLGLTLCILFIRVTFFGISWTGKLIPVLYLLGNVVFIIFDIAVTRAIVFYTSVIHPKINK